MYNEQQRLNAVERFKDFEDEIIIDLNGLVHLTSQICETPVALITLVDNDTQWFKAAVGTEVTCTPRELSFCNYTIIQREVVIIPDLSIDERFQNNLLVINDPHTRFYAGCPLVTKDGYAVGSLCVIDFKPSGLTAHQINSLKTLAKQVVNLMELNWSLKTLEIQHHKSEEQKAFIGESEMKLKAIFDSSKDTHILVGADFEVLAFNKSAAVFIKNVYNKEIAIGDCMLDYTDGHLASQFLKYFKAALTGRSIRREWQLSPENVTYWKETSFTPVKDRNGKVIGVAINSTDITTRKRQEEQINIQNDALTRIAIIQSHELRRPVASLLGIMDLMRIENIDSGYFNMLELTVNELDGKIKGIVKDSEDTIQGSHLSIVA